MRPASGTTLPAGSLPTFEFARSERGSAVAFVALGLGALALALLLVAAPARLRAGQADAQWAAEAAALAAAAEFSPVSGVAEPSAAFRAAQELALANGAEVVSVRVLEDSQTSAGSGHLQMSETIIVDVNRHGIRASAAAARFAVDRP